MEASLVEDTPGISINSLCSQENVKVALGLPVLHFLTTCIVKSISCKRNRAKTIPQVLKKSLILKVVAEGNAVDVPQLGDVAFDRRDGTFQPLGDFFGGQCIGIGLENAEKLEDAINLSH
jgi:hypothetical protein